MLFVFPSSHSLVQLTTPSPQTAAGVYCTTTYSFVTRIDHSQFVLTKPNVVVQLFTSVSVHGFQVNGFVNMIRLYVVYISAIVISSTTLKSPHVVTPSAIVFAPLPHTPFATAYNITESIVDPEGTPAFATVNVCLLVFVSDRT